MDSLPENELRVLELRKEGKDFDQIAQEIGKSKSGAYKMYTRALARYSYQTAMVADEIRAMENEKLDQMELNYLEELTRVLANNQMEVDKRTDLIVKLQSGMLKVIERRAKMEGLDAPTRVDSNVTTRTFEDALKEIEGSILEELSSTNSGGITQQDVE